MATKTLTSLLKRLKEVSDFNRMVDYYYENCMDQHRDDKGAFHPSSIGSCHMAIAYSFLGYEQPAWSGENMRKVENGTFMHLRYDDITKRMTEAGVPGFKLIACNVPISIKKPVPIKGHLDAIVEIKGVKEIFEYKSIRSEMFSRLEAPSNDYKMQWMTYSEAKGIPNGRIIYENKNTQEIKEFKMVYDKDYMDTIYKKLINIYKYVKVGKLPPLPKGITSECTKYSGCAWFDKCWE